MQQQYVSRTGQAHHVFKDHRPRRAAGKHVMIDLQRDSHNWHRRTLPNARGAWAARATGIRVAECHRSVRSRRGVVVHDGRLRGRVTSN